MSQEKDLPKIVVLDKEVNYLTGLSRISLSDEYPEYGDFSVRIFNNVGPELVVCLHEENVALFIADYGFLYFLKELRRIDKKAHLVLTSYLTGRSIVDKSYKSFEKFLLTQNIHFLLKPVDEHDIRIKIPLYLKHSGPNKYWAKDTRRPEEQKANK